MRTGPLALTPGEPAGIGPDLVVSLAASSRGHPWVAIADPGMLERRAEALGIRLNVRRWDAGAPVMMEPGTLSVCPVALPTEETPGTPDPRQSASLLDTLGSAIDGCLDGTYSALVTGPVQKSTINEAGFEFRGHTEFIASRTGGEPVMMLVAGDLRVALVTTHLPLRAVPDALTRERVTNALRVLDHDLRTRFGVRSPRIRVLGLNPHAGEGGHLGREELEIIGPAVDALRAEGMQLDGPVPADTAFRRESLDAQDAVLAMYHDQGLPVLKHTGFGHAVNVTLGLPIVRTSVDHGTALHLAGTGRADAGSMRAAIDMAVALADNGR